VVEVYKPFEYDAAVRGLENLGEGSWRCHECYRLRLRQTAQYARDHDYDFFTTTLSVSPHKNAAWVQEIGLSAAQEFGVAYLDENFRKKDGYKRSLELSRELGLYRQNYCGCKYSKQEAQAAKS
jgi:predicted adenine nucleotide alpha hydrolase (AANH) superfamily ATPase